jgi:hypothetical protein
MHCRERGLQHSREALVVETDDGNIIGNFQMRVAQRRVNADGGFVVTCEYAVKLNSVIEQLFNARLRDVAVEMSGRNQFGFNRNGSRPRDTPFRANSRLRCSARL